VGVKITVDGPGRTLCSSPPQAILYTVGALLGVTGAYLVLAAMYYDLAHLPVAASRQKPRQGGASYGQSPVHRRRRRSMLIDDVRTRRLSPARHWRRERVVASTAVPTEPGLPRPDDASVPA
jgi:hypothetical protein